MALKVYYGIAKQNKILKKRAVVAMFENGYSPSNEWKVSRWMEIVHTRNQTEEEALDAEGKTRMFTNYSIFVDDKTYKGSLEKALAKNHADDSKHVSLEERDEIKKKIFNKWMERYPDYKEPTPAAQLELEFC